LLFNGLSRIELGRFAEVTREIAQRGVILFEDVPARLVIRRARRARQDRIDRRGRREVILGVLGVMNILVSSLVDDRPRSAHVIAMED
jgi:hypothetical protein